MLKILDLIPGYLDARGTRRAVRGTQYARYPDSTAVYTQTSIESRYSCSRYLDTDRYLQLYRVVVYFNTNPGVTCIKLVHG